MLRGLALNVRALRERFTGAAPARPWWQRLLLPVVGLVSIVVGLIFLWVPLAPTSPFLVIGIPFLFCFHPRCENAIRRRMVGGLARVHHWLEARVRRGSAAPV